LTVYINESIFPRNQPEGGLHPYIYRGGILTIPGIDQGPLYSYQTTQISSTIIVFNLALAHHLSAGHGSETPQKLFRALKLYDIALDLQRKKEQDS
jgi:hypothetical protein